MQAWFGVQLHGDSVLTLQVSTIKLNLQRGQAPPDITARVSTLFREEKVAGMETAAE